MACSPTFLKLFSQSSFLEVWFSHSPFLFGCAGNGAPSLKSCVSYS